MTDAERKAILARLAKANKDAQSLSREEARQRLIKEGLYTEDGRLSARYGGKAAATR